MATVEDLLVRIDASTEVLRRELKKADSQLTQSSSKIDRALGRIDKRFKLLGASAAKALRSTRLGAVASVAGIGLLVRAALRGTKTSIEFADSIVKVADAVGLSTDALQEFRFAADKAGVGTEALDKAVGFFIKSVGELRTRVSSELTTALKDYDQSLLSNIKNSKSQEEAFKLVVRALEKETDATKRAALAKAAFGRAGLDLVNIGNGVAGTFERDRKAARDLGAVLEENLLRGAVSAKDELTELERQIEANTTRIMLGLSPALVDATGLFADFIAAINDASDALGNAFVSSPAGQLAALEAQLAALEAAEAAGPRSTLFESAARAPRGRRGQSPVATPGPAGRSQRPGGGGVDALAALRRRIEALREIVALEEAAASAAATAPGAAPGADMVAGLIPIRKDLERANELLRAARATIDETRTATEIYTARLGELDHQLALGTISQETYNRAVDQAEQELEESNAELQEAKALLAGVATEEEKLIVLEEKLNGLVEKGALTREEANKVLTRTKQRTTDLIDEQQILARGMDAIDSALAGNMDSWRDWARVAVSAIEQVLRSMVEQNSVSSGGGGLGGILGSVLGPILNIFGGVATTGGLTQSGPHKAFVTRAGGGDLAAGQLALVGEKGPELFRPAVSGTIIPNNELGGGGGNKFAISYNIDARGAERGVEQDIVRAIKALDRSVEPRAIAAVVAERRRLPRLFQ